MSRTSTWIFIGDLSNGLACFSSKDNEMEVELEVQVYGD